ncbi:MAG: hypothetical protein IJV98_01270 [Clostridia bacterium]|nr:hypothetical protein [Clostridia bacterium]
MLIVLVLAMLLLCGCHETTPPARLDGYRALTFLTGEEHEALHAPLVRFCEWMWENSKSKDDFVIDMGYGLSLFDMDLDGTPEVLVNRGGGSSAVLLFEVYDLDTFEQIGSFIGGYEDDPCVYYDTETGDLRLIQQYAMRMGWEEMSYRTEELHVTDTGQERIEQTTLFAMHRSVVDVTDEGFSTAHTYTVNGEEDSEEGYFFGSQAFFRTNIRIPETAHRCVYWWDLETYKNGERGTALFTEMADTLLFGTQRFIAVP